MAQGETHPPPPAFVAGLPLTASAYAYATELHAGQRRGSDSAPFILHPLEVASLLHNRGFGDDVVAAGLLHDVVEDTAATRDEVRRRFGEEVARLVAAVTDDPRIEGYAERKAALREQVARGGPNAQAIYAADKVTKARELRAELARRPGHGQDPEIRRRLEHYQASLGMLEREAPDLPLVRQLRFELWALAALPPAG